VLLVGRIAITLPLMAARLILPQTRSTVVPAVWQTYRRIALARTGPMSALILAPMGSALLELALLLGRTAITFPRTVAKLTPHPPLPTATFADSIVTTITRAPRTFRRAHGSVPVHFAVLPAKALRHTSTVTATVQMVANPLPPAAKVLKTVFPMHGHTCQLTLALLAPVILMLASPSGETAMVPMLRVSVAKLPLAPLRIAKHAAPSVRYLKQLRTLAIQLSTRPAKLRRAIRDLVTAMATIAMVARLTLILIICTAVAAFGIACPTFGQTCKMEPSAITVSLGLVRSLPHLSMAASPAFVHAMALLTRTGAK